MTMKKYWHLIHDTWHVTHNGGRGRWLSQLGIILSREICPVTARYIWTNKISNIYSGSFSSSEAPRQQLDKCQEKSSQVNYFNRRQRERIRGAVLSGSALIPPPTTPGSPLNRLLGLLLQLSGNYHPCNHWLVPFCFTIHWDICFLGVDKAWFTH